LVDHAAQFSRLGDFRVLSVLGQGGTGIVYDATWGPRRVALKVLHPSLVSTARERAQFLTEAARLQQITHPAVVKVLAAGELPDGRPYLAMERLEGETLASVVARGALSLARALELFAELGSAVSALHARGLVHRDLKPENVFVVADRHAVLLDFGIAKDLSGPASTTTQEGNVRGTPAYMAPERFFGQPAGIATDVYELAVILYVMLAGRLPWDSVSDPEARLSPRPLVELAGVPDALDIEVRRALSTRAQNRPASAEALVEAIRTAASAPVTEPEPGETARLRPGARDTAPPDAAPGRTPSQSSTGMPSEQQTPLAWTPTIVAPSATFERRRRRLLAVTSVGALVTAGMIALVVLRPRDSEAPAMVVAVTPDASVFSADDPWAERPSTPAKTLALVGAERSREEYRAEAAAAIARLPGDTRFVFATQLADLRSNSATAELLAKLAAHPRITPLGLLVPPCVKAMFADAEWFVFGAPSVAAAQKGTLIVRGRWRSVDVETCLGDSTQGHVTADGAKQFRVGAAGWLDFLDEHTAYIVLDTRLDAADLHAMLAKPAGLPPRTRQLLATLPVERSVAIVADGKAQDDWATLSLPKGSDLFGWLRVEQAGVVVDFAADPHNQVAADATARRIKPELDEVFGKVSPDAVGKLEVVRTGTTVRLKGNITSLVLGIVTASLGL
jgi:serine/threonine protein kinase